MGWSAMRTARVSYTTAPRASLWGAPEENARLKPARNPSDWEAATPIVTRARYASLPWRRGLSFHSRRVMEKRYSQRVSRPQYQPVGSAHRRARTGQAGNALRERVRGRAVTCRSFLVNLCKAEERACGRKRGRDRACFDGDVRALTRTPSWTTATPRPDTRDELDANAFGVP